MKLNKIQFNSMAFQEQNRTCGMKLEHSGRNLAKKSGTDRDLKWDENCFVFWIGKECFDHSGRNEMELTTLGEITPYIKFDIILASCAWSFNLRFNSFVVTQLSVNHMQTSHYPLKLHILSILCEIAPKIKFGLILIPFAWDFNLRFNSAANWSYKGFGCLNTREWPINKDLLFVWYQNSKY